MRDAKILNWSCNHQGESSVGDPCYLILVLEPQHRPVKGLCRGTYILLVDDQFLDEFPLHGFLGGEVFLRCPSSDGDGVGTIPFTSLLTLSLVQTSRIFERDLPLGDSSFSLWSPFTYLLSRPILINPSMASFSWIKSKVLWS